MAAVFYWIVVLGSAGLGLILCVWGIVLLAQERGTPGYVCLSLGGCLLLAAAPFILVGYIVMSFLDMVKPTQ